MTTLGTSKNSDPQSANHNLHSLKLPNGLTLIAESMPWLESAAFALLIPAGTIYETPQQSGLANLTCEMMQRGSGSRTSREFVDDLENLGADCSGSASLAHTSFGGAMPAGNLKQVLEIYADVVRKPHLPEDQFDDAKLVCLQDVRALEDELSQKMMQELRKRHYADPFGRSSQGTLESLEATTHADVAKFFQRTFHPTEAILSVAGKIDWDELCEHVEKVFGDWSRGEVPVVKEFPASHGYHHIGHEAGETHIGLAFDSVHYSHPDYFQMRGAVGVLSDGMSSRLFTEVREKRGLVYTVYASCHSLLDRGSVFAYAGTTTDKAQETLDVLLGELQNITAGIRDDELKRVKAHLKTSIIMQQESSRSRAGSIAGDWYHLGRVRPMAELQGILNSLTAETINRFLADNPPGRFTVVSLGEKELEVSREIL